MIIPTFQIVVLPDFVRKLLDFEHQIGRGRFVDWNFALGLVAAVAVVDTSRLMVMMPLVMLVVDLSPFVVVAVAAVGKFFDFAFLD